MKKMLPVGLPCFFFSAPFASSLPAEENRFSRSKHAGTAQKIAQRATRRRGGRGTNSAVPFSSYRHIGELSEESENALLLRCSCMPALVVPNADKKSGAVDGSVRGLWSTCIHRMNGSHVPGKKGFLSRVETTRAGRNFQFLASAPEFRKLSFEGNFRKRITRI